MNKDIKKYLDLYIEYGYISHYSYTTDEFTIRYTLPNGLETERTINYDIINGNLDDFLNFILKSADNLGDDIYSSLIDENDFFGYSSEQELEERIKEEETYLKSLIDIYKLRSVNTHE